MTADHIECWLGSIDADATHDQWQCLNAAEFAHATSITNPLLRNRYVIVRSRLRQLLGQKLVVAPESINFSIAAHGKPYLADCPELAFNLSHSANHWAIAIGRHCRLGVDIEIAKPRQNLASLVEKCFGEPEAAYWHSLPEAQQTATFYRFWTRKEAFVKATGRGIALGLKHCVLNPEQQTGFLSVPDEYQPASAWRIQDIALAQGFFGALALDSVAAEVRLIQFAAQSIQQ